MLDLIKLPNLGAIAFPYQMSGGQQQRVALARAHRRAQTADSCCSTSRSRRSTPRFAWPLRDEDPGAWQRELGITTIYVTHDQEEALSMSDRIVVMNAGRAEQIGTPHRIYNRPATRFVASFVGTLNLLDARLADPATGAVEIDGQPLILNRRIDAAPGATVSLALRPEAIMLGLGGGTDAALQATVRDTRFLGSVQRIEVAIGRNSLVLDTFNTAAARAPAIGERVEIAFSTADVLLAEG